MVRRAARQERAHAGKEQQLLLLLLLLRCCWLKRLPTALCAFAAALAQLVLASAVDWSAPDCGSQCSPLLHSPMQACRDSTTSLVEAEQRVLAFVQQHAPEPGTAQVRRARWEGVRDVMCRESVRLDMPAHAVGTCLHMSCLALGLAAAIH